MTEPTRIVPLFPLPDTILFPGQILPLHIFEPRYRRMTHDLLDASGDFVIGTVLGDDQSQLGGVAPVQAVGGLGRLERYEKLDDGRYMIVVVGQSRVRVQTVPSEKEYPLAEVTLLHGPDDVDRETISALRQILSKKQDQEVPSAATVAQLVDILIMTTRLKPDQRYELFAEPDLNQRAKKIVNAYEGYRDEL